LSNQPEALTVALENSPKTYRGKGETGKRKATDEIDKTKPRKGFFVAYSTCKNLNKTLDFSTFRLYHEYIGQLIEERLQWKLENAKTARGRA
jgi:hypothetical protein